MLKNYLLTSLRSLKKHFAYSVINIGGLGMGLAICLLLLTWVRHELSYDQFHADADQLYRSSMEYSMGGQTAKVSVSPTALLPTLKKNFQEVEEGVRLYNPSQSRGFVLRVNDKLFEEHKFYYADSTLFKVFSFSLADGNVDKALVEPNTMVISQSMAKKYFGDENPIGQLILVNNRFDFKVTGVLKDIPANSLLKPDFIGSFSSLDESKQESWWSANYQTFIKVSPGTSIPSLQSKLATILEKEPQLELPNKGDYIKYNFMPLKDIYLRSDMNEAEIVGSIQYVYIFGAIALLVLIIACINYINLATAKAADRAKEVGVRKAVGAHRKQLFFQFISESAIVTFCGFALAFLLASLALPFFNSLTGKTFSMSVFFDPAFISLCMLSFLIISLTAGAYPAIAITSFKPVSVLKGNFRNSSRGIWLRQSLVVFQFSISIMLTVGTIVILKQLNFIQNKQLGFEKDNVIVLPLDRKINEQFEAFKTELLKDNIVEQVGRASESPTKIVGGYSIAVPGSADARPTIITATPIDTDFITTFNMKMTAGRNLNDGDFKRYESDTVTAFILNQSAIQQIALSQDQAVGTIVTMNGRKGPIVGVVEDFHFSSMHEPIRPLVMFTENPQLRFMFLKLAKGNVSESLVKLEASFKNLFPHRPFEFQFLNEQYNALYEKEERMGNISVIFSILAIAIACLGLIGLVTFAASQKTKEIGIRKVLGATANGIVILITKDFTKLVLIAIVIGLPFAYWIIDSYWLSSFVYRTTIGAGPLALAAIFSIIIAWGASSYQAIKAAWIDPSKALRSE